MKRPHITSSRRIRISHYSLCAACLIMTLHVAGCMTRHADLAAYPPISEKQPTEVFVQAIEYDDHGFPVFSRRIAERPGQEGAQFIIVQYVNERPIKSFDIAVLSQKPDMLHPLKVIYEWTGKGFRAGVASGKAYADSLLAESQKDGSGPAVHNNGLDTTFAVGPVFVLSIGGFIVGVVASVPVTARELSNLVVNSRESVVAYTIYEYDAQDRLHIMKTYLPDDISREIIKTEYHYLDEKTIPYKTEIISYPEQKIRTIPESP